MNRSVLARQMFANGGAAFPDLSGDGKITQKDILMGRGVPMQEGGDPQMAQLQAQADAMGITLRELLAIMVSPPFAPSGNMAGPEATMLRPNETYSEPTPMSSSIQRNPDMENYIDESGELFYDPASGAASRRQMFDEAAAIAAKYQQPVGMAMGGDPAMAQGVGSMMPPPPAMPEGQGMAEQVMDPQVLEGLLSEAQNQVEDLDQAEDYETVMNTIRGDEASVEERYEELAGVVGEEDARQTPESVLTLVQPAMVMGAVDQGIGGLAQQEMMEPVQGAMAQGIMSTVEPPQPAGGMGGPPPVNFKDGGLVRRGDNQPVLKFAQAGVVPGPFAGVEGRLGELARERMAVRQGLIGDPSARIQQQEDLTKSQMLFDIANTALAFAAPMEGERPGASAAERLAMAARTTQLPQTIGARAAKLGEFKTGLEKEKQALQLAALGSAEAALGAEAKAAAAERKAALEAGYRINEIMLKQTGEMELAQSQADWKASLQDDQQLAAQAIERLRQAGDKESIRLSKKLEKQNAIATQLLKGEQALEQIGLQGMNAIAKQEKAHIQALAIQENNQALSREQKQIDVGLKTIDQQIAMDGNELKKAAMLQQANAETRKAKLDQERLALEKQNLQNTAEYRANQVAIAYADQEIKEAQMLQAADAATQQQILRQKELELKERKILIDEAAAGLSKFGSGTQARITTFLSDPDRIKAYKDGTMGKDETLEMNTILTLYANPIEVWNEQKQAYVTQKATPLSNEVMDALRSRKQNNLTLPSGIDIPGLEDEEEIKKDDAKPEIGDDLAERTFETLIGDLDAASGTGPPAAAARAINTAFKTVLPFLNKPFSEQSRAARLIKNINAQATLVYITDFNGRPNLQMQEMIQETLPKPEQWYSTDQDAINAIENTIAAFNSRLQAIDVQLLPASQGGVGGLSADQKSRLSSQKESLKIIRNAYVDLGKDYIGSGTKGKKDKRPIEDFIGG